MKTILREALELLVEVPNNEMIKQWSEEKKLPIREVLVLKEIANALRDKEKSKQRIWEYMEGKPVQANEISGPEGNPVSIINIEKIK